MSNNLLEPEGLVECPFDRTHMIRNKRLQYHIAECQKNFPNHNLKKCPFNARHWIPKPHFQHHVSTCPDRRTIEAELEYQASLGKEGVHFGGNVSVPSYETRYVIDETENWDDEATSSPFKLGENKGDYRNTSNTEPIFVHPAERADPVEIRLPKQAPRVLQNNIPLTGYGRGAVQTKARQEQGVAALQRLGRGRGRGQYNANPGTVTNQVQSFADVFSQNNSSIPHQQSLGNGVSSLTDYHGTEPEITDISDQLYINTNSHNSYKPPTDSPYSSGSNSPNIPALARKHGSSAIQARSVNATNRFSPSHSGQPSRGGDGGLPLWMGRGRGATSSSESSPIQQPEPQVPRGIGRGIKRTVNVPFLQRNGFDSTGSNSPCSHSDSDQFESDYERDKLKEERKIRKKLKQIEVLEDKQRSGQQLTTEEVEKIHRKSDLVSQMDQLKLS